MCPFFQPVIQKRRIVKLSSHFIDLLGFVDNSPWKVISVGESSVNLANSNGILYGVPKEHVIEENDNV